LSEVRKLCLSLSQQIKETLEKKEKNGAAAKPTSLSPPDLDGSVPFFDFRNFIAKAEHFMQATEMNVRGLLTHLISHTKDESTLTWLTTLQNGSTIKTMQDLKNAFEAKFNHGGTYDSHINGEINRHVTEESETLLDSINRFHARLASGKRPYLYKAPLPGTEADILEEQDCTSFLNGQIPEDHEKIRQTMNIYQVTQPKLTRYQRMAEAVKALASNKQSILGCPYVPRPAQGRSRKSVIPDASTALPLPINSIDETPTSQADPSKTIDEALTKAVNALNSKFDQKLNKLDRLTKSFNTREDKPKPPHHNNQDRKPWTNADYIGQSDLEQARKDQLDPAKHKPYYRLAIKETKDRLCTLCAAADHLFPQCPKASTLAPYRQMAIEKIKEARAEKRKRGSGN